MFLVFPASGRGAPCYHDYNIPTSRRHVKRGLKERSEPVRATPSVQITIGIVDVTDLPTTTLTLARLILIFVLSYRPKAQTLWTTYS